MTPVQAQMLADESLQIKTKQGTHKNNQNKERMTLVINTSESVLILNEYSQLSIYHTLTFFRIPKESIDLKYLLEIVKKGYLHSIEDLGDCLKISARTEYVEIR